MSKRSAAAQLARLRDEAATCTNCELYERATQTVFGEGRPDARLMMVGEQPGDKEDRQGHVFVGPAGHLLDRALADAGIERDDVYLTNAVKHFNWRPSASSKVRIHQKPSARHVAACTAWWEAELAAVEPELVCCLGAVAAQALLGKSFRVTKHRGELVEMASGLPAVATVHPSAVLRANDRDAAYGEFVRDLAVVRQHLRQLDRVGSVHARDGHDRRR